MIKFSALKHFWNYSSYGQAIDPVLWHVMAQIDNKIESTNQANHMTSWRIW